MSCNIHFIKDEDGTVGYSSSIHDTDKRIELQKKVILASMGIDKLLSEQLLSLTERSFYKRVISNHAFKYLDPSNDELNISIVENNQEILVTHSSKYNGMKNGAETILTIDLLARAMVQICNLSMHIDNSMEDWKTTILEIIDSAFCQCPVINELNKLLDEEKES